MQEEVLVQWRDGSYFRILFRLLKWSIRMLHGKYMIPSMEFPEVFPLPLR